MYLEMVARKETSFAGGKKFLNVRLLEQALITTTHWNCKGFSDASWIRDDCQPCARWGRGKFITLLSVGHGPWIFQSCRELQDHL